MDGTGETPSSPLPQTLTKIEVKVDAKVNVNRLIAPGIAKTLKASPVEDAEGVAGMRRRGRRPYELLAASPPRYPQAGKIAEGDEIEEVKTSHQRRRLPDTHR